MIRMAFYKIIKNSTSIRSFILGNEVRALAHTDLATPDFSEYRRNSTKDNEKSARQSIDTRRLFTYTLMGVQMLGWTYCTKAHTIHYVSSMAAAADVLALAKIEINLNEIQEGESKSYKWRGAPLFVKHRTDKEIEREKSVSLDLLRDPETDEQRCPNPKWLVAVGICTHLGCVPVANAGDFGGYYCPCHGSHFDACGRTRKGPAPTNLKIPEYTLNDNLLIVG